MIFCFIAEAAWIDVLLDIWPHSNLTINNNFTISLLNLFISYVGLLCINVVLLYKCAIVFMWTPHPTSEKKKKKKDKTKALLKHINGEDAQAREQGPGCWWEQQWKTGRRECVWCIDWTREGWRGGYPSVARLWRVPNAWIPLAALFGLKGNRRGCLKLFEEV